VKYKVSIVTGVLSLKPIEKGFVALSADLLR